MTNSPPPTPTAHPLPTTHPFHPPPTHLPCVWHGHHRATCCHCTTPPPHVTQPCQGGIESRQRWGSGAKGPGGWQEGCGGRWHHDGGGGRGRGLAGREILKWGWEGRGEAEWGAAVVINLAGRRSGGVGLRGGGAGQQEAGLGWRGGAAAIFFASNRVLARALNTYIVRRGVQLGRTTWDGVE